MFFLFPASLLQMVFRLLDVKQKVKRFQHLPPINGALPKSGILIIMHAFAVKIPRALFLPF